uniref:Blue (type 1) copper domain-containing protein n=2 Tax=Methanobacteriati TaxID=3366610 RepID=A0A075FV91_9EURY|nr:hypothetical protein [uncultured marine group II/III euryarchaeote AD1000_61_A07]
MRFTLLSMLVMIFLLPSFAAEVHTIYVVDYAFETPDGSTDIEISIGDTIIFQWNSTDTHNVAQIENEEDEGRLEGGFYSGEPISGTYNWTLPEEHTTSDITLFYICEPHYSMDSMRGKIIVGAGSSEPVDNSSTTIPTLPFLSILSILGLVSHFRRQHSN